MLLASAISHQATAGGTSPQFQQTPKSGADPSSGHTRPKTKSNSEVSVSTKSHRCLPAFQRQCLWGPAGFVSCIIANKVVLTTALSTHFLAAPQESRPVHTMLTPFVPGTSLPEGLQHPHFETRTQPGLPLASLFRMRVQLNPGQKNKNLPWIPSFLPYFKKTSTSAKPK